MKKLKISLLMKVITSKSCFCYVRVGVIYARLVQCEKVVYAYAKNFFLILSSVPKLDSLVGTKLELIIHFRSQLHRK